MTNWDLQERQRFSELLPFWINDTLDEANLRWIEGYRLQHPETQSEIEFLTHLQASSQTMMSKVPEPERLKNLLDEWQFSRRAPFLHGRLSGVMRLQVLLPVAPVVMVVALCLFLLVSEMGATGLKLAYRGERRECASSAHAMRVVFNPEARHFDVVLLLRELELTARQGPSETGEFWLSLPPGRSAQEALTRVVASALVEQAIVLNDELPVPGCGK